MEVQSDGHGGFNTDQVLFGDGSALDLAHLSIEFRFLGATDPNAFQASGGFDLDTFFGLVGAQGEVELADAMFAQASYSARSDAYRFDSFTFSASSGATFVAVAVPEPGTWALMLSGLVGLAALGRRRHQRV